MVPSVAQRGSSFKGAGAYYLHDKGKDTSERVAWSVTHNVPTQNPEKALNWMAYTAMNADSIKMQNGGFMGGYKSQGKPVYAYSLAWHETDQPSREEMEKAAFSSLEKLGLKDHEAVIVAHQDQKHPHIHVITNLVNKETGKTQAPKMDYKQLSTWAQAHDLEHGREHCPLRKENNQKRYKDKAKTQFVKHKEAKHQRAQMLQQMATQSKNGQEFRERMEAGGFTLAQGHKGRLCVVDSDGKSVNLTRQLKHENGKGYRAKDLRAKLEGVDLKSLPSVKDAQAEREREAKERGESERRAKMAAARSKTRQENRSRSTKKGQRYDEKKGYISKEDIDLGNDREAYRRMQDEKMIAAALKADQERRKGERDKLKTEQQEQRKEREKERTERNRKAAEARQEMRHNLSSKNRTAFRDGGKVGDEFNAEVQDERSGNDDQARQLSNSRKTPEPQLTPFKRGRKGKVSHPAKVAEEKTPKDVFNEEIQAKRDEEKRLAKILRKKLRGEDLTKKEEDLTRRGSFNRKAAAEQDNNKSYLTARPQDRPHEPPEDHGHIRERTREKDDDLSAEI